MAEILDKPIAALILCDPIAGSLRIAALTLPDRLVVALHRGGCSPIQVACAGALPSLQRSKALGIVVDVVSEVPSMREPVLIADCRMLVQPVDVRAVIHQRGRLADAAGQPLTLGLVKSFVTSDVEGTLKGLVPVRASGVAGPVESRESAAERDFASLGRLDHQRMLSLVELGDRRAIRIMRVTS